MTEEKPSSGIREKIFTFLSDLAPEIDPKILRPDLPLRDQVEIDSIDFLRLIVRIHEELKVDIPESDYLKLDTLDHMVSYITKKAPPL